MVGDLVEAEIQFPGDSKGLLKLIARVSGTGDSSDVFVAFEYQSNSANLTKDEAALIAQMHNFKEGPMKKALADQKLPSCETKGA
jgi:hypothetical protein